MQPASSRLRFAVVVGVIVAGALSNACGPTARSTDYRAGSESFAFTVSTDPIPPHAREPARYRVIVRDKETRQPIENGEGQIFASSQDGANTWDALLPGPELGSYYGTLNFITSGTWAMAIRFRLDSTEALERVDWTQDVMAARNEPVQY
ncbi:MAG: hypothetical protein ACRENI_10595 [Gemmatimonadaceae bacterium]